MSNSYFHFKQFTIQQDRCAMKVTTDACLFGAWTSLKIKRLKSKGEKILDIGTGTGLLALMIAQQNSDACIEAIEISREAALQAEENIAASPWLENIRVIHADINNYDPDHQYDIIVCNPPFYENELKSDNADRNTALHDSSLTLNKLAGIIKQNLAENGRFYLLLPFKREQEIKKTLNENNLQILHTTFVRQSHKHGYFRLMVEVCLRKTGKNIASADEISIKDNEGNYTAEFSSRLKDFYMLL